MMPAKMVTDREKATTALWATGETYADEVAAAFGQRFAPVLMPGETLPDIALMQRLSVREVVHKCQALTAADRAHGQRQREVIHQRAQRAAAMVALRSVLVAARQRFEGTHHNAGRHGGQSLLGFEGRTPDQPNALVHQAAQTIAHLRHLAQQPALIPSTVLWADPTVWADQIEPARATLARCLADLEQARDMAAVTLVAKRRAMKAFDNAYSAAVRELACLYKLVGLPARAEALPPARLRRQTRRTAARATKVTAFAGRPPTALPAQSESEGALRVQPGAESVSEAELRAQKGDEGASEGELRFRKSACSASEGELRVENGAVSASEDALRVQHGAQSRFSRTRRRKPSRRAVFPTVPAHRMVSPRHVSAHRRRARA